MAVDGWQVLLTVVGELCTAKGEVAFSLAQLRMWHDGHTSSKPMAQSQALWEAWDVTGSVSPIQECTIINNRARDPCLVVSNSVRGQRSRLRTLFYQMLESYKCRSKSKRTVCSFEIRASRLKGGFTVGKECVLRTKLCCRQQSLKVLAFGLWYDMLYGWRHGPHKNEDPSRKRDKVAAAERRSSFKHTTRYNLHHQTNANPRFPLPNPYKTHYFSQPSHRPPQNSSPQQHQTPQHWPYTSSQTSSSAQPPAYYQPHTDVTVS